MGEDGEELLNVLAEIDQMGKSKLIKQQFVKLMELFQKINDHDRFITTLFNWISGVAQRFAQYWIERILDVWKESCHAHMSLANDLQNTFVRQFMRIKPVTEGDADNRLEQIAQSWIIELKRAKSIEDMYKLVNTYMFDSRANLLRRQTNPMLYLTESPLPEPSCTQDVY